MDSLNFVSVIFTVFFVFTSTFTRAFAECDFETNNKTFYQCVDKWSLFRNKQTSHTTWLTDDYLTKEICSGEYSLEDMNNCIRSRVVPACDSIIAYWTGLRRKYSFLCKWRQEFLNHYQCRADTVFTTDVNNCVKTCHEEVNAGMEYCSSTQRLRKCLHRALEKNCLSKAEEFFKILFDLELEPLMIYAKCDEDFSSLSVVESIDSPQKESDAASRRHASRGHPSRRKQNGDGSNRLVRIEYQRDVWDVESTGKTETPQTFLILILTVLLCGNSFDV